MTSLSFNQFDLLSEDDDVCERAINIKQNDNEKTKPKSPNEIKKPKDIVYRSVPIHQYQQPVDNSNHRSHKRILCYNILGRGVCGYGDSCVYAHSLEEQHIDPAKKRCIDLLLQENSSFKDITIEHDRELYDNLLRLTRKCSTCEQKNCAGGYNCKYGACDDSIYVCLDDFNNGMCTNPNCKAIHLTKRGLIPYLMQTKTFYEFKNNFDRKNRLEEKFEPIHDYNPNHGNTKTTNDDVVHDSRESQFPQGVTLDELLLKHKNRRRCINENKDDSDSDDTNVISFDEDLLYDENCNENGLIDDESNDEEDLELIEITKEINNLNDDCMDKDTNADNDTNTNTNKNEIQVL